MFPFITHHPLARAVAMTPDLVALLREVFSGGKLKGENAQIAARSLLESGYLNEAAALGEWGQVQKDAVANRSVSIYVPCFNGAKFLKETLGAILDQSFRPCEIIVVDDGSTDESASLAAKFPVRLIQHRENRGLAASRNTALKAVSGEFIAGIDADTIPDRFWLERVMSAFTDESIVGAAGRLIERHGATAADSWRQRLMAQHHGDAPRRGVHLFGCNSVIRTKVLRSLGGFNEACKTSFDDIDLSERILKSGVTTAYVPEAVCYHCRIDDSKSIVESAYRWRVPPFEMQGAFKDSSLLSAKWLTEVREGMKDVMGLEKEGRDDLLFITYYGIFASIIIDLSMFFNAAPSDGRRRFAYAGLALMLRALSNVQNIALKTKQEIALRLLARFQRDFTDEKKISEIKSGVLENLKPELLIQKIQIPVDEDIKRLTVSLGELGSVLSVPPQIGSALDTSLLRVLYDDSHEFKSAMQRVAIIASHEISSSQWGSALIDSLRSGSSGVAQVFRTEMSPWRLYEVVQEIQAAKPTEVMFLVTPETAPLYASLIVPIICRLPSAELKFVSQAPLTGIPVTTEVR